jgi:hypothetical protein
LKVLWSQTPQLLPANRMALDDTSLFYQSS